MTDEEHARAVREALAQLERAVIAASEAGLRLTLNVERAPKLILHGGHTGYPVEGEDTRPHWRWTFQAHVQVKREVML
jgi:hypothetical protein